MVYLDYPKLLLSIHTHPSDSELGQIELYRPQLRHKVRDPENLIGERIKASFDEVLSDRVHTSFALSPSCGTHTIDSLLKFGPESWFADGL